MTDGATLSAAGKQLDLSLVKATEGNSGYDISALMKETGNVTLDGGFTNTASCTWLGRPRSASALRAARMVRPENRTSSTRITR